MSIRIRSAIWSIQSPSGYKRIIVGQGHLAKELSSYEGAGTSDPDVVYLDDGDDGYRDIATATGRPISSRAAATCMGCRTG